MENTIIKKPKYKVGQIVLHWDGLINHDALLIAGIKDEYYMVVNLNDVLKQSKHSIYEIEIKDVDEWTSRIWDNYYELRNSNIKVDYYDRTDLKF
jgi:dsDNA-specific endonuclease/ATPase MutS2